MKLLLLLGVVFFGAEAESQEIQKLLASARQLNQTLGSLAGHTTKTRRLQSVAPTAACEAACDGIQCAYDDSEDIGNRMSGADALTTLSFAGELMGGLCFHRTAMTCAAGSTQCVGVVGDSTLTLDLAPCICDACPDFPKIYEGMGPLVTAMQHLSTGSTPTAAEMDALLTALCPMSSVLECLDSNSACSSVLTQTGLGSSLNSLASMKSQCATAGKATSYTTSYTFVSPTCSAQESSDADGLLQLNLLAGSFSLFSILN